MDILSNFSENVSELLNDKKITVEQFANEAGITLSEVYRYLRKEYVPKLSNIIKIADAYEYSIDYLLGLIPFPESARFRKTPPFSDRLKELLDKNNLSRYRLSMDTQISINRIDDWYHGKFTPSLEKSLVLAKYFKCTLDYLLGREV